MIHAENELYPWGFLVVFNKVAVILVIVSVIEQCDPLFEAGFATREEQVLRDAHRANADVWVGYTPDRDYQVFLDRLVGVKGREGDAHLALLLQSGV